MSKDLQASDFSLFITGNADISAPMITAYETACAYPRFEAMARNAGFEVARHGTVDDVLTDIHWTITGPLRGKIRQFNVAVTEAYPPVRLHLVTDIAQIEVHSDIQFTETGRKSCHMAVRLGFIPRAMTARLLLHSLRLSRPRLTRRLERAMRTFARKAERRARKTPG